MAEITAAMVKALRLKTDAPMMECKNALTEVKGDLAQAEELLRVKLGIKASQIAARTSAEGLIGLYISTDGKEGALVEVNCETDFVAKNEEFCQFVNKLAERVATQNPASPEALSQIALGEGTVETQRTELIGRIRENISVRRFQRIATDHQLASYIHGGKIGVLVEFSGPDHVGKDLAMHIAATKPRALDTSGVSSVDIETERSVAQQKAAEAGKPEHIATKMVEGAVQKFVKEVALLSQPFVKNDKQSVEEMLKALDAKIYRFILFIVGEGIEKKTNDFAAEVAAVAQGG